LYFPDAVMIYCSWFGQSRTCSLRSHNHAEQFILSIDNREAREKWFLIFSVQSKFRKSSVVTHGRVRDCLLVVRC
jgi:hypothetical protein